MGDVGDGFRESRERRREARASWELCLCGRKVPPATACPDCGRTAERLVDAGRGSPGSMAKRSRNRETSADILRQHDVGFIEYNGGAHLAVRGTVDFWPGTGKWIVRATREEGRGVFKLLKRLGVATNVEDLR